MRRTAATRCARDSFLHAEQGAIDGAGAEEFGIVVSTASLPRLLQGELFRRRGRVRFVEAGEFEQRFFQLTVIRVFGHLAFFLSIQEDGAFEGIAMSASFSS